MAGPSAPELPPPLPPPGIWTSYPAPDSSWQWPPPPPPPGEPGVTRRPHRLAIVAGAVSAALVGALLVGGIVVVGHRQPAAPRTGMVPTLQPAATPPSLATSPPAPSSRPLPAALPTGIPVAGGSLSPIAWTPYDDGTLDVTPSAAGVELALSQAGHRQWLTPPNSVSYHAIRIDATDAITSDSRGNGVGLACRTPDLQTVATFTVDSNGEWLMQLEQPGGTSVVNTGVATTIQPPGAGNTLSVVCGDDPHDVLEMMLAINGIVVADNLVPLSGTPWWFPALFVCSCDGPESVSYSDVAVSAFQPGAFPAATRIGKTNSVD